MKAPGYQRIRVVVQVLVVIAVGCLLFVTMFPEFVPEIPKINFLAIFSSDDPGAQKMNMDDLLLPPPQTEAHVIWEKGRLFINERYAPSQTVHDFPGLGIPQHVPENGIVPFTRRIRHHDYTANSVGMRSRREYTRAVPDGTFRACVIGTGVTFGHSVEDEYVYAAQLEQMLQTAAPEEWPYSDYEVLNFGLSGRLVREASRALDFWSVQFDCPRWIIVMGVNDSLPCFGWTSVDDYQENWEHLLGQLEDSKAELLIAIEPVNTFYPWLHRYQAFNEVMRKVVSARHRYVDIAGMLDCTELTQGLRLEIFDGLQHLVHYRNGVGETAFSIEHPEPGMDAPWIPMDVFDFLDNSDLDMAAFYSDVHLNERGHELTAQVLFEALIAMENEVAIDEAVPYAICDLYAPGATALLKSGPVLGKIN
jgi:hypothetical protein